jgi:prepilin-type N-terminal cleavage/methylation domain-containing protein
VLTGRKKRVLRSISNRIRAAIAGREQGLGALPGRYDKSDSGFSLIELVVATSIIATLSLTAVLGLRVATQNTPANKMDEFARGLRFLQAEALYTDRSFALSFANSGWEVMVFSEPERTWSRRPAKKLFSAGDWGNENRPSLQIEGLDVVLRQDFPDLPTPDVFLLPSGETTPFVLTVSDAEGRLARCTLHSYGELECQRG